MERRVFSLEYLTFGLNYAEVSHVYLSNLFGGLCVLIIESLSRRQVHLFTARRVLLAINSNWGRQHLKINIKKLAGNCLSGKIFFFRSRSEGVLKY